MNENKNDKLSLIFKEVFSTENGKIVLKALESRILDNTPYCLNADIQTDCFFREGGRQIIEFIYSQLENIN
jgi:hypothetical protein